MKKASILFVLLAGTVLFLSSCREKTPSEKVEDGIEEVGDGIEDGLEEVGDGVEDAVD